MGSCNSGGKGGGGGSGTNTANFNNAFKNVMANSPSSLSDLSKVLKNADISGATLTANGNSIKLQVANITNGDSRMEVYFSSSYNPMQVNNANKSKISSGIYANLYKGDSPVGIRTIAESKSTSLKNAKTQYESVLSTWKNVTNQDTISTEQKKKKR